MKLGPGTRAARCSQSLTRSSMLQAMVSTLLPREGQKFPTSTHFSTQEIQGRHTHGLPSVMEVYSRIPEHKVTRKLPHQPKNHTEIQMHRILRKPTETQKICSTSARGHPEYWDSPRSYTSQNNRCHQDGLPSLSIVHSLGKFYSKPPWRPLSSLICTLYIYLMPPSLTQLYLISVPELFLLKIHTAGKSSFWLPSLSKVFAYETSL